MLHLIWLIFAALFLSLGIFHWITSRNIIPHAPVPERPFYKNGPIQVNVTIAGSDELQPLKDFVNEFNSYIDHYNQSQHRQNILQAFGYLLASAVSLFSFFLVL